MYAKGNSKIESSSIFRFVRVWWVPVEMGAAVIRERDLIISEADYNLTRRQ